jgi:hypothetical protein
MTVTWAFLAESAASVDNKLNVSGGVLSRYAVGPERLARFVLVLMTEADSDDPDRRVSLEFRPPTFDEPVRQEYELPEAAIGKFPGFAFFNVEVELPVDGRWLILVSGSLGTISIPLIIGQADDAPQE